VSYVLLALTLCGFFLINVLFNQLFYLFCYSHFATLMGDRLVSVNTSSFNDSDDAFSREVVLECGFENDLIEDIEVQKVARADSETNADPFDEENSFDSLSVEGSKRTANHSPKTMASLMVS